MGNKKLSLHKNQNGMVSFMVVMFIMFVVSLIVLAFSRMVQRDQTQTLDRQLNTQAFYAAESGVNDAINALTNNPSLVGEYTNCSGAGSFVDAAGLNGDLGNGISYSCLLVDSSPKRLEYPDIPTSSSSVAPLRSDTGSNITSLRVYWDDAIEGGAADIGGCQANTPRSGVYPQTLPATCEMGTLRLELVPFLSGGATSVTRSTLMSNRGVVFITPRASGGDNNVALADMDGDDQGYRINGDCGGGPSRPRRCYLQITGLNMRQGYLRMQSIYRASNVSIEAYAGLTRVGIEGAQAEIDVTGRATDVLKRIKVAAPLPTEADSDPIPEFALQTTKSQCKRFYWRPSSVIVDSEANTQLSNGGLGSEVNNLCNPLQ